MIAGRNFRVRKCCSAPSIAWSKSLCSKSFISVAPPGLPVAGVPQSGQQAEVELREGVQGIAQAAQRRPVLAELFADGADHREDAGGLGSRNPEQALEASFFRQKLEGAVDGFFRRELACSSRAAQEIEQRRITLGKAGPCFRPARMNDGVAADEFAGQAEGAGGNLAPSRRLCRESEKIGGGDSRRENAFAP